MYLSTLETLLRRSPADDKEPLDPYAERIVEAATQQFLEFGLQRTSLDRIAAAAGVSRGTLFNRFPNRDALVRAVAARELRRFFAQIDSETATASTPEGRLIAGMLAAAHGLARNPLLRRLLVTDRDQVLPLLTTDAEELLAPARVYVAAEIVRAQEEGMALEGDPEVVAEVLVRIAHSLALAPETVLPLDDDERLAEQMRTSLLPLLTGRPAR